MRKGKQLLIEDKKTPVVWLDPDDKSKPLFVVIQDDALRACELSLIVDWARDAVFDGGLPLEEIGTVYIKEPGRGLLDLVNLSIEDRRVDDDSGTVVKTLVVTNLVAHREHKYGLE